MEIHFGKELNSSVTENLLNWTADFTSDRLTLGLHVSKVLFSTDEKQKAFGLLCQLMAGFLDETLGGSSSVPFSASPASIPDGYVTVVSHFLNANDVAISKTTTNLRSTGAEFKETTPISTNLSKCLLVLAKWLPADPNFGAQILSVQEDSLFIKLLEEQMDAVGNYFLKICIFFSKKFKFLIIFRYFFGRTRY